MTRVASLLSSVTSEAYDFDTMLLGDPKRIILTSESTKLSIVFNLSYPIRFTYTLFRVSYEVGLSQNA